jgi:hypothetical protein
MSTKDGLTIIITSSSFWDDRLILHPSLSLRRSLPHPHLLLPHLLHLPRLTRHRCNPQTLLQRALHFHPYLSYLPLPLISILFKDSLRGENSTSVVRIGCDWIFTEVNFYKVLKRSQDAKTFSLFDLIIGAQKLCEISVGGKLMKNIIS